MHGYKYYMSILKHFRGQLCFRICFFIATAQANVLDKMFPDTERIYEMTIKMLKGKIHRATVVQAELDYVGSITIDEELLEAAGILEYEQVQIVDVNNGSRFETYAICGERGSGMICLNGAAARCVSTGTK